MIVPQVAFRLLLEARSLCVTAFEQVTAIKVTLLVEVQLTSPLVPVGDQLAWKIAAEQPADVLQLFSEFDVALKVSDEAKRGTKNSTAPNTNRTTPTASTPARMLDLPEPKRRGG